MNKSESKYFNTAVKLDKALLSLLEKKSFEYITVSDLCKEAGVNRSTFYLHYENTSDLLMETTQYVLDGFLSYFNMDAEAEINKLKECDKTDLIFIRNEYLHPYLKYIKDNQKIFISVLSRPTEFKFESIFQRLFDNVLDPVLDRFGYPPGERKYVLMFYLNGITAIITEWLKEGCKKSIEEISEVINYCIFGRDSTP